VSLTLPGHDATVVADRLARDYSIGVRAGQFCAHPLTRRLTGAVGVNPCGSGSAPGLLRISFGLGTTDSEVDRLVIALSELASGPAEPADWRRAADAGSAERGSERFTRTPLGMNGR
jgi:selenocysteine lyase/cysteine desulfurase